MTARKLPAPAAVELAFTDRDLVVLQEALDQYMETAVPRLLDGEFKHLMELAQRFAQARDVLAVEEGVMETRARLKEAARV